MKLGELFVVGIFVLALFVLLAGLPGVRGEPVNVDFSVVSGVNITVNNDTLLVVSNNVTYNYTLSNTSQFFIIPVSLNESRQLLNLTVQGQSCGAENYTSSLLNISESFEAVVRAQLVPSQQQYHDLELLRLNDSFDCQNAKNILSNEILNYRVMLNSSEIAFNATKTILNQQIEIQRNDIKNWKWLAIALLFISVFLMVYAAKGWSPRFLFDNFVNQKFIKTKSFSTGEKGNVQPPQQQSGQLGGGGGG